MSFEFGKPEVTAIPEIPTKGGTSMLNKVLAKRAKERDLDLESNKPLNPNPGPQFDEKKAATILAKSKSKTKLTFKGEIELSMDLTKVPKYGDGSPPNLDALIPPGIKSLKVEFKVAGPEGKLTTRLSHTALRAETGSDDIGFYYLNDKGIKTPIKLPLNGEAKLTISPTDFENLTTTEIETRMAGRHARLLKKALTEGSKKALFGMAELMASDTQTSAKQAPPEPYYSQASYSPKSPAPSSGQLPDSTALPPKPSPQPLNEITQLSHSQDGTTEELMVGKYKVIVTRIPTTGEVSKIKCEDRTLLGPVRPEALDIIRQITPDEPFVKVPDPVNPKKIITTRESTYKLLLLANEFAKKDGFIMGCTSHWRNLTNQTEKFANSDGSGKMVATPGGSNHHSGGALDLVGCRYFPPPQKSKPLPGRSSYAVLKKYLGMVGFANYDVEGWHHEVGTEQVAAMMMAANYITEKADPREYSFKKVLYRSKLKFREDTQVTSS